MKHQTDPPWTNSPTATAYSIPYRLTFTDINYTPEIWSILSKLKGPQTQEDLIKILYPSTVPFFESRYLLTSKLISKFPSTQVAELAAGFSPRGIAMTGNPDMVYVELDLMVNSLIKQETIKFLETDYGIKPAGRLILETGDALNDQDFARMMSHFDTNKPVHFINEGLMRYLTHDQKKILAKNIYGYLKRFGGKWFTPDIVTFVGEAAMSGAIPDHLKDNFFRSVDQAMEFFRKLGFMIDVYYLSDMVGNLKSIARLGLDPDQVVKQLRTRPYFVMSVD